MSRVAVGLRSRRRGATIIELIFTLALSTTIITTITLMYGMAATRTRDVLATVQTASDVTALGDRIDAIIRLSTDCTIVTVGGRNVLRCRLAGGTPTIDNLGFTQDVGRTYIHPRKIAYYEPGKYAWIYTSNSSGDIFASGTIPFLAYTASTTSPTSSDIDPNWSFRDGATKAEPRYLTAISLDFSIVSGMNAIQTDISVRAGAGSNGVSSVGGQNDRLTSTSFIANWRGTQTY